MLEMATPAATLAAGSGSEQAVPLAAARAVNFLIQQALKDTSWKQCNRSMCWQDWEATREDGEHGTAQAVDVLNQKREWKSGARHAVKLPWKHADETLLNLLKKLKKLIKRYQLLKQGGRTLNWWTTHWWIWSWPGSSYYLMNMNLVWIRFGKKKKNYLNVQNVNIPVSAKRYRIYFGRYWNRNTQNQREVS